MPDPRGGVQQVWRMLRQDGVFFVSVDIGGVPTPDEPTVFSTESLRALFRDGFDVVAFNAENPPHSQGRLHSVRLLARKREQAEQTLDKSQILQAYEARLRQLEQEDHGCDR
jgi:hypothetical protein